MMKMGVGQKRYFRRLTAGPAMASVPGHPEFVVPAYADAQSD
jgi:hypothetical protein